MTKQQLLEVSNLKVQFHSDNDIVTAVRGISFKLERGETLGIVGESGSGKSVSALSLMRLVPEPPGKIAAGSIRLFEGTNQVTDLLQLPKQKMQTYRGSRLAMIFQEPMSSLNPIMRCGEQVAEAIRLHQNVDKSAAHTMVLSLFEKVHLPQPERIYKAYPHELSGGQKQRVMIAMAMSCEPDILIADEPTTALDVTVQKAILDLIQELKDSLNAGVIFISHDLGVIGEICDRVLVMYQGEIVEQGLVKDIFTAPQHPYTRGLLACRPPLEKRLYRLPVIADFLNRENKEGFTPKMLQPAETKQRLIQLQSQEPILKVEKLKTWFPAKRNWLGKPTDYIKAVDEVSFEVFPGETMGLVGESGCGKTTLGRSILRLVPVNSGNVIFESESILDMDESNLRKARKDLQIIFQDPYSSLNPRMTIGRALIEPMEVHGIGDTRQDREERARELLRQVQLEPDHYGRYPHQFSGGQRQRVCIARALAVNPKFIVCDESVSALDVSIQAQILNLLKDLQEAYQLTYIFISHDLSVVKFMSDRMMVMQAGKIVEQGPADDIYENPATAYTQKLIAAIPKGL